jgi:prolyl 4-hydroxylase
MNFRPIRVIIEVDKTFQDHMLTIATCSTPNFEPSTIWTAGQEIFNPAVRKSEKAALPRDQTVKCIEDRARKFQGWKPFVFIEKLWAQRYAVGGHYTYHFDWSMPTPTSGRVSSFMVYLESNCTGGGTHFPRLPKPMGDEWCKFIECGVQEEELKDGVIFKPVKGNAVYWENLRDDGTGFWETWHAGLPVTRGRKVGLNIWSWLQVGYVPKMEGEE